MHFLTINEFFAIRLIIRASPFDIADKKFLRSLKLKISAMILEYMSAGALGKFWILKQRVNSEVYKLECFMF